MLIKDLFFLLLAGLACGIWVLFAGRSGYTGNNAMIVARSISVAATIEGEVEALPVKVGSIVAEGDLMARIQNGRIDRSRLTELESQLQFLRSEVASAQVERRELEKLLKDYEKQASSYAEWFKQDLQLRRQETLLELEAAKVRNVFKVAETDRMIHLAKNAFVSAARLDAAKADAAIAKNEVEVLKSKLSRIDLMLRSIEGKGVFREDGDTNYWEKIIDALRMRVFDNEHKVATMRAQIAQAEAQATEERSRLSLNFVEEHRAPAGGVINAVFTTEGKRVVSGAPLFQILDCDHPIAIVAIPDNRFGDFRIGQKATVMPIDSNETFVGTIQHISSGPLIGRDTTIAIQQDVTLMGNKVIVGLDDTAQLDRTRKFCNSTRRAVVTIHTPSLFDKVVEQVHMAYNALESDAVETVTASIENIFAARSAGARPQSN
jgi:multidrug resistance efflux pump